MDAGGLVAGGGIDLLVLHLERVCRLKAGILINDKISFDVRLNIPRQTAAHKDTIESLIYRCKIHLGKIQKQQLKAI